MHTLPYTHDNAVTQNTPLQYYQHSENQHSDSDEQ